MGVREMSKLKTRGKIHSTTTGYNFLEDAPLTLRKATRLKCLECCAGSAPEVKRCQITDCTLWPYRMPSGVCVDPAGEVVRKKKASPAQIEAGRRLAKRFPKVAQN